MTQLAEFPIKEKSKIKSYPNKTYDRRVKEIEKLKGKHNGWWIYQYCRGILNERQVLSNQNRR